MNPAIYDQTTIDISAGNTLFRAQGSVMKFPGFTIVYTEGRENGDEDSETGKTLPLVSVGEILELLSLKTEQKFTQPPPRFSEASLVRELEEKGIGRPSTYATILSTIQDRDYVRMEKGKFSPTDLGMLVTDLLVKNFPKIMDVTFTASLESQLDMIEEGKLNRIETLHSFHVPFEEELKNAKLHMRNVKKEEVPTDRICEKCGSSMVIKWGKNGNFIACSNYPACKNTQNFTHTDDGRIIPEAAKTMETDRTCDKCGLPMLAKRGKFGPFLGCSGYPECKNIISVKQGEDGATKAVEETVSDVVCGACGRPMLVKRGKFGPFLGCSGYPECQNLMKLKSGADGSVKPQKQEITDTPCTKCGRPMAVKRGRFGPFLGCSGYPECKNIMKREKP